MIMNRKELEELNVRLTSERRALLGRISIITEAETALLKLSTALAEKDEEHINLWRRRINELLYNYSILCNEKNLIKDLSIYIP